MTRGQTAKYRSQLRVMLDRIDGTVAGLEDQARMPTSGEAGGSLSNAPLHLGDVGSEVYSQELGSTLLENEAYIRLEIVDALGRIDNQDYGRCENCKQDIAPARLDALPYARYCIRCAADLQAGAAVNLNKGRPESWLGEPGHEAPDPAAIPGPATVAGLQSKPGDDVFAAGTPGGGTAVGGLAGTTVGGGDPAGAAIEGAMGSGTLDDEAYVTDDEKQPQAASGPSGGAVGGPPAKKRSRSSKTAGGAKPKSSGAASAPKPTKKANRGRRRAD
jgi:RNA polymerase-binding transcription factor DksA